MECAFTPEGIVFSNSGPAPWETTCCVTKSILRAAWITAAKLAARRWTLPRAIISKWSRWLSCVTFPKKTVPTFIGDSHAPVPVRACDPYLPIADAGKPDVVGRLNDERVHEIAFAIDSDAVGPQQTPGLTAENSPFADPIFTPVLPKAKSLFTRRVQEVRLHIDA